MSIVTLLFLPVIVAWIATLIMHSDIRKITYVNFAAAVIGGELAAAFVAPAFGISMTGEYGLTASGTFITWLGAMSVLLALYAARRCANVIGVRRRRNYLACTRRRLKSERCGAQDLQQTPITHQEAVQP